MQVINLGDDPILTVYVRSESSCIDTERRFNKALSIVDLKNRLEPITGISVAQQKLSVWNGKVKKCDVAATDEETVMLGSFPIEHFDTLQVDGRAVATFDDPSVPKYEMDDRKYDQLPNSVRQFKRDMKLGRFVDAKDGDPEKAEDWPIRVDDRCLVDGEKRATVRFIGVTQFQAGIWVGVEFDEPVGKNDGQVDGVVYFKTTFPKHGSFVRPQRVLVGDYPELDILDDEMEEI